MVESRTMLIEPRSLLDGSTTSTHMANYRGPPRSIALLAIAVNYAVQAARKR